MVRQVFSLSLLHPGQHFLRVFCHPSVTCCHFVAWPGLQIAKSIQIKKVKINENLVNGPHLWFHMSDFSRHTDCNVNF